MRKQVVSHEEWLTAHLELLAKAAFEEDEDDQRCQRQTHLTDDASAGCGPATSASRFWKCQRGTSRCLLFADAFDSLQYVAGSAVVSVRAAAVISESI
jgi:hypothetical protein